ncbi:MAG: DNA recombination protein RmuC, partial [Candidatus Thiodiazotropha sp.]
MEWFTQASTALQLMLVLGFIGLILFGWVLYWLARLLDTQQREQRARIHHQQTLLEALHELERHYTREQSELRDLM